MNFLSRLNPRLGESTSDGASSSTGGGGGRSRKRVFTPAELETSRHIHFLLNRMETLTLPEDRRNNMEQLTQAVREHPDLPVDGSGVRTLISLARSIQADRQSSANLDLSLQAVEMLKILLTPQAAAGGEDDSTGGGGANATNAPLLSLFVQTPAYITTLLELLSEKNSVLRLYTIQCLTSLLMMRAEKVQSIVLNHPMGVMQLVELLSDPSEVIRNETLLLLEALTRGNKTIQQIVAFNGAFDKLLIIAAEELAMDGGIIAEDAMRLVASLLADNASNQALFLEQGCVHRIMPYLSFRPQDLADDAGPAFEFLGLALEIINHTAASIDYSPNSPPHKNLSTRHSLAPLVAPLLALACSSSAPPVAVRHDCWALLAMLVDSHARNQAQLDESRVQVLVTEAAGATQQLQYPNYAYDPQHNPYVAAPASTRQVSRNALRHLLELACDAADPLERFLLLDLLRAYFANNSAAQVKAMMSFAPSPTAMAHGARQGQAGGGAAEEDESGPALGTTLLAMLAGSRPQCATFQPGPEGAAYVDRCRWVASQVMQHMLSDNRDCQVMLLTLPLGDAGSGGARVHMLDYFIGALFASQNHGYVEISLLSMLCSWADGCLEINEAVFGKYSSNLLAYLVQMARDQNVQPLARGLATYYIALVLELVSNPPAQQPNGKVASSASASVVSSASLLELITQQVSLERFKANLAGLQSSAAFQHAHGFEKDLRQAQPLNVHRKLEGFDAELSAPEEAQKALALLSAMHETLALSTPFVARFKVVHDKVDQRLLHLFTSAAGTPAIAQQAMVTSASASATQPPHSGSPAPTHGVPGLATAAPANGALEQQLRALQEENARLKQQQDLSAKPSDAAYHVQQLQQQLSQAQAEIAALRGGSSAGPPSGQPSGAPSAELVQVRAQLAELLSEHEDLLILLASQEIELEQARRPAQQPQQQPTSVSPKDPSRVTSAASTPLPSTASPLASPLPSVQSPAVQPPAPAPFSSLTIQAPTPSPPQATAAPFFKSPNGHAPEAHAAANGVPDLR